MKPSPGRGTGVSGDDDRPVGVTRTRPHVAGRIEGTRLGFWAGMLTAILAAVALVTAITTPPRSGPYCQGGCIAYPYTDAAGYVPRDYLWMYPAMLAPLVFIVLAVCVHLSAPAHRRRLSLAGTGLAVIAGGILSVDYGLQLSVMQPSLMAGETSGLSLLSQYNPHGVFIGLENIGYGTLALSLVFLGASHTDALERKARVAGWIFSLGGALILLLLVAFAAVYQNGLEYRFEVIALLLAYLVLIAGGALLGVVFSPWRTHEAHVDGRSARVGGDSS